MKDRNYARMHTAEHILNRTMQNMFGCGRCFSAHINPKKSKCDYRLFLGVQGLVHGLVEYDLIHQSELGKHFLEVVRKSGDMDFPFFPF